MVGLRGGAPVQKVHLAAACKLWPQCKCRSVHEEFTPQGQGRDFRRDFAQPSYRYTDQGCGCSRLSGGLDWLHVARLRYTTKVAASKSCIGILPITSQSCPCSHCAGTSEAGLWLLGYLPSDSSLHWDQQIHGRLEQAPVLGQRQHLRRRITQLLVCLNENDADLMVFSPQLAQSFERNIGALNSAVGAGILDPLEHRSIFLEHLTCR